MDIHSFSTMATDEICDGMLAFAALPLLSLDSRISPTPSGYTAKQLFSQGVCYTYDDCIFHPGHIYFGAHEASERWLC